MRLHSLLLLSTLCLPAAAIAQTSSIAAAVAGYTPAEQTFGKGVQIYSCQAQNGTPQWVFLAPDAVLYQLPTNSPNGPVQVATHSSGPVWQWNDGSGLFGTVLLSVPSPNPNSVPSLLVLVQHFGTANGTFSPVSYVVRSDAFGGTAPAAAGCDMVHIGTTARVPYTATYTFYSVK